MTTSLFFTNREINSQMQMWKSTIKIELAFLEIQKIELEKKMAEMVKKY